MEKITVGVTMLLDMVCRLGFLTVKSVQTPVKALRHLYFFVNFKILSCSTLGTVI